MTTTTRLRPLPFAASSALALFVSLASAEEDTPAEEAKPFETTVNYGVGIRTELGLDPSDANEETALGVGYNVRPYIIGQVHPYIKFEGNLDADGNTNLDGEGAGDGSQNVRILDAVIKFEVNDLFNVWTGHFLPPADRANLSGPYFQNAWNYPVGQHIYPSQYAGRNDGIAYWGQVGGGAVKWQFGIFDLLGGTPDPTLSGRLTVNLLDPESGYYNSSSYYGSKDILAIGAVFHHITDSDPTDPNDEAATVFNFDFLYENSFAGAGTLDVEGAFYGFGGLDAGNSFSALASFMLASKTGIGHLQPMLRLQRASWGDDESFGGLPPDGSQTTLDAALQYIIDGHNARLAATVTRVSRSIGGGDADSDTVVTLGAQIQRF